MLKIKNQNQIISLVSSQKMSFDFLREIFAESSESYSYDYEFVSVFGFMTELWMSGLMEVFQILITKVIYTAMISQY